MPTVPDADLAAALAAAEQLARRRCPTQALYDQAVDKATDAILRAIKTYDPSQGKFASWARSFAWMAIHATLKKPLPRASRSLAENVLPDDRSSRPLVEPSHYEGLPKELRVAAVLYHVHGYTLTDAALLCGVGRTTLRQRLRAAAELLAIVEE